MKKYYSMVQNGSEATIDIYGDITSYPWSESDVSAYNLSKQLEQLDGVSNINVYINSYGGEVAEGLAIYNALKRHSAKVTTYCDGFACSIASVIFAAGDERIMSSASLLMIHNAWTLAAGNAEELRKQANDLDKITEASKAAYLNIVSIAEKKLQKLMDAETWISPKEAVEMGFATSVVNEKEQNVSQSVKNKVVELLLGQPKPQDKADPDPEPQEEEEDPEPETDDTEDEEDPEDDISGTEEEEEDDKEAAEQKLGSFFNAIFKQ